MLWQRFKFYKQLDSADCGPTCLRMIFKHYGKEINPDSLKKDTQLDTSGTSLLGLSEAAEKFGFKTISAKITFEQLINDVPLPCILHWNQYHFVVLTPKVGRNKVTIADPNSGIITFSKEDFLDYWISKARIKDDSGIALILTPTPKFYERKEDKGTTISWKTLLQHSLQYKLQLWVLFFCLLLGSILQLAFPFLTQGIVDKGIDKKNFHIIQLILLAQFTLFLGRTVFDFIRSRILLYIASHINVIILSDFWIKLMRLPLTFFDSKQTGDVTQRVIDHQRIENFITGPTVQTFFSIISLIVFSIVLLNYSLVIFSIFMIGSILYFLWISFFLKWRRSLDYEKFNVSSKESSMTMQLIQGMQEIKLNNAENAKQKEWRNIRKSLLDLNFKSLTLDQYQQAGAFFINEGKNILLTFLVATYVLEGKLTMGTMVAIQYIIGQLNSPIEQLISFAQHAQDAKISLERLNEVHQYEEEEPAYRSFLKSLPTKSSISFKNFEYTYPGAGNKPILKDITLKIEHGQTTAIVGTSGSGKTTLLKILLKFYTSYSGSIKVGDVDLKDISPQFWRSQCGSVMQEGFIFNETIANNITIGDESPDFEKLTNACQIANILEFIQALPLRFESKIGTDGIGLSTGQKQRILIARAIYKNPHFIFFDEATNALDSTNEKTIMNNLMKFLKGKTVVIVAHRLSTVKDADKIIVLEKGLIIEEGDHATLSSKKGRYYELVKNQLELGN